MVRYACSHNLNLNLDNDYHVLVYEKKAFKTIKNEKTFIFLRNKFFKALLMYKKVSFFYY